MNINAGTNQYNLSLNRGKERPSFYTIFDKLNNRKLNSKKPLNAILTQDQMYRYYLNEVEPKLAEMPDNILEDLNDESIGNLKIRDFVELLSGNLDLNKGPTPVYETLSASVSYPNSIIGLIAPSTPIPPPPPVTAPAVTPVVPAPVVPVVPAPVAPVAPAVTPVVPPSAAPVAPAVTPVVPTAALTISTAPTGIAMPPFSPTSVFASLSSAVSSGVSTVSSLVKPSLSVPPSVVASGAATVVGSGVPTGTPVSGVLSPTSGTAAAVGVLPIDTGGYTDRDRISAFTRAITEGLTPPRMPVSKTKTISKDEDMIKYAIELSKYNDGLKDKKFTIKPTTAVSKMITIYERLNKRGATEDDIIIEIKKGK